MDLWKCYKTIVYEIYKCIELLIVIQQKSQDLRIICMLNLFVHLQQMWKITKFALDNFLLKILQYSAWFEYL